MKCNKERKRDSERIKTMSKRILQSGWIRLHCKSMSVWECVEINLLWYTQRAAANVRIPFKWTRIEDAFDMYWTNISKDSESQACTHAHMHASYRFIARNSSSQVYFFDCNNEFPFTSLTFISIFKDKM